jgi:hypothetical protein
MSAAVNTVVSLTRERIATANSAAYEIELTVQAMRALVDDKDGEGEIHPLMQGMVVRVTAPTSAIANALDPEGQDLDSVKNTVYVTNVATLVNRS